MREVRPTLFFGVPRVWEKIYEKMQAKEARGIKKSILQPSNELIARPFRLLNVSKNGPYCPSIFLFLEESSVIVIKRFSFPRSFGEFNALQVSQ